MIFNITFKKEPQGIWPRGFDIDHVALALTLDSNVLAISWNLMTGTFTKPATVVSLPNLRLLKNG